MVKRSKAIAFLVVGWVLVGSAVRAAERAEGPLITAGLWEVSGRAVTFEWQEYPNTVKVIPSDIREVVCEDGVRHGGEWIRSAEGALIKLGVGTSESGMVTSSLWVYSGDFARRYVMDGRYETFGLGQAGSASAMVGLPAAVHAKRDATRIGECPADMKPGEIRRIEKSK
jgi:hypothetical protein